MTHKAEFKVGDLVRVSGRAFTNGHKVGEVRHHIKPGSVVAIQTVTFDAHDGEYYYGVSGPSRHDVRYGEPKNPNTARTVHQCVYGTQLKPAKQAMRKRDEYQNRRG